MTPMFDWSDIRSFLAVMRHGSAAAAARALATNQTTVSRRIARLERATGLTLFEPGPQGARPTANARALMSDAEAMEASAAAIAARAAERQRSLSGTIRITTTTGVPRHIAGLLRGFQDGHPGIRFDIDTTETVVSLEAGEADIAVRSGQRLEGDSLIARKIIDHPWAFYASDAWIARNGVPQGFGDLAGHHVVVYTPEVARRVAAITRAQSRLDGACGHFSVTSVEVMLGLLLEGEGPGLLPVAVGDREPGLTFCFTEPGIHETHWLVWTREAEAAPHTAAFLRYCSENIAGMIAAMPPSWRA
ncbi:LysR family transcriptional regulator [Jannaschia sp. KMU-145]|uniref:LysR family transcriptional regulator n=1 Tax=Jannaschia halovivens TaxID=3388667 RepID=UPI00396B2303